MNAKPLILVEKVFFLVKIKNNKLKAVSLPDNTPKY